jgi:hypothetical protein
MKNQINKNTLVINNQIANGRVSDSLNIFLKSSSKNDSQSDSLNSLFASKQIILIPPKRDKHAKIVAKANIIIFLYKKNNYKPRCLIKSKEQ